MEKIEIDIQLDPIQDGANWVPDKMKVKGSGALIIGTNGEYRFVKEEEASEILAKLLGCCEPNYLGKTSFLVLYNSKKLICTGDGKFLVGSAMIMKATSRGIAFLEECEIDAAKKEFERRIVTLCGNGIQFSAYEIG